MNLPEDVLDEIVDQLALKEYIQLIQTTASYNKEKYWKKYYHQYNLDLKTIFPTLSYQELVQILYKVNLIINEAKISNVYMDLTEPIYDTLSLIINSHLTANSSFINAPLLSIEIHTIERNLIYISLYTKKSDFMYVGYLNDIKLFLSYLIFMGRI